MFNVKYGFYRFLTVLIIIGFAVLATGCNDAETDVLPGPMSAGSWSGDTFTNDWAGITFELPDGFRAMTAGEFPHDPPGQTTDVNLINEHSLAVISLIYVDVPSEDPQFQTAGDYLDRMRRQLTDYSRWEWAFPDVYEPVSIAGKEFLVKRAVFYDNESPDEFHYQDGYVYRFHDTLIVFLAAYNDDTRDSVNMFFQSIEKAQ